MMDYCNDHLNGLFVMFKWQYILPGRGQFNNLRLKRKKDPVCGAHQTCVIKDAQVRVLLTRSEGKADSNRLSSLSGSPCSARGLW
jgi:hypothetical protein